MHFCRLNFFFIGYEPFRGLKLLKGYISTIFSSMCIKLSPAIPFFSKTMYFLLQLRFLFAKDADILLLLTEHIECVNVSDKKHIWMSYPF